MDSSSWRERTTARLAGLAPVPVWRMTGAFLAGVLTTVASTGGLFYFLREPQIALAAGVCAGIVAPSRRSAAIVGFAAVLLGMLIGPPSLWADPSPLGALALSASAVALGAGAVAFVSKVAVSKSPALGRWLTWAVVGMIVVNVWATVISAAEAAPIDDAGRTYAPLARVLSGSDDAEKDVLLSDQFAYLRVVRALKQGKPFYRTWYEELGTNRLPGFSAGVIVVPGQSAGNSVFNYHLPTSFLFWAALPGSPLSILYAYLVLVSLAVATVPFVTRGTVRLPLTIPAAAAVASYLFPYGYSTILLAGEQWAGAIGVLAVAAWARSTASERWKAWTVTAVALGLLAALVREPAVLIPLAGLGSTLLVRNGQRRFRATAWAVGLAVFAELYLVHYLNVRPLLSGPSVGAALRFAGLGSVISALTYGTPALGASGLLPLILAAAGVLGMMLTRDGRLRAFLAAAASASLFAYLFVSNNAREVDSGVIINYWGAVIVPTIYACVPAVLALVPAMSPGAQRDPAPAPPDPGRGASRGTPKKTGKRG